MKTNWIDGEEAYVVYDISQNRVYSGTDAIPGIAFGEGAAVEAIEQPASEIPSTPASHEVVEIAPKPLAVKSAVNEPVQVAPVEVIEETPEEATNWRLWLIGALVVLGGLAVMVRRKN